MGKNDESHVRYVNLRGLPNIRITRDKGLGFISEVLTQNKELGIIMLKVVESQVIRFLAFGSDVVDSCSGSSHSL